MVFNYGILCYGCRKSIRRNQTSENVLHVEMFYISHVTDKLDGNLEKFYCSECTPPEEEKIVNSFAPPMSDFIAKRGMKILHHNINGSMKS